MSALEWFIVIAPMVGVPLVTLPTVALARFLVYRHAERTAREIARVYATPRKEMNHR